MRNVEKGNAIFLFIYLLELIILAVRTLFQHHYLMVLVLGYPHWILVSVNFLLLFGDRIEVKVKLASMHWL